MTPIKLRDNFYKVCSDKPELYDYAVFNEWEIHCVKNGAVVKSFCE